MVFFESLKTLSTVKFIIGLIQPEMKPLPYSGSEIQKLATETIEVYLKNITTINLWAKEYGFKVVYYWQPTIFSKPELSDFEKKEAEKYGFIKDIVHAANLQVGNIKAEMESSVFYNISDIFRNESKPIFIDYCHVSEYGNSVIANKMAEDIAAVLK